MRKDVLVAIITTIIGTMIPILIAASGIFASPDKTPTPSGINPNFNVFVVAPTAGAATPNFETATPRLLPTSTPPPQPVPTLQSEPTPRSTAIALPPPASPTAVPSPTEAPSAPPTRTATPTESPTAAATPSATATATTLPRSAPSPTPNRAPPSRR